VAYSDASGVSDFAVDVDSVNGNQRTTPAVTAAASGSALISYWADKSSDNVTGWTLPGGVTERGETVGSGGGRISAAIGDTLNLSAGAAGGLTAVTDSGDDRRGAAWSLIIAPE
jgi:ADP-ribose pyrophosphatase YjhB (NUDIX family)